MNTQIEVLNSEATDDSYDKAAGDWAYFSAPKANLTPAQDIEESPRRVLELSVKEVINPKAGEHSPSKGSSSRAAAAAGGFPTIISNENNQGKLQSERSPRSRNDKVQAFASARQEQLLATSMDNNSANNNMEEGLPSATSRSGEIGRQRSSRSHIDDNSRNRKQRDKDMDDSRQRQRSDRSMDGSGKQTRPTRREGRRQPRSSRNSENLDARLREDSGRIPGATLTSSRSMDGSVGGNRERKNSRRDKMRGAASSRNLTASGDAGSVRGDQIDARSSSPKLEGRRPRSSRGGTKSSEEAGEPAAGSRLKRSGTRTRRSDPGARLRSTENGPKMRDGSDRDRGDRRMSDNSGKNHRMERRERKEGRRHSEEGGRRMSNGREGGGRRSLDESNRPRRRPKNRDAEHKAGETRRKRRERVLRSKDTYIPPPSKGGEGDSGDDSPPLKSGPVDVAPSENHRSSRQNKRSPMDMPPMDEEDEIEEEEQFETTWQRSAPPRVPRTRRSLGGDQMGVSPRADGRRSMSNQQSSSPAAQNTRRPGRDRRGANVRQTQLVNMVLLHEEEMDATTEESEQENDDLPGLLEDPDEDHEEHPDISASKHEGRRSTALKAAVKASSAVGKVGAKAAVSTGKASVAAAKGAGKAVKGVLGFRKKKKPLAYAEGEHSQVGLVLDSGDDLDKLGAWDEDDDLHGSGGTSLHGSGPTSLHGSGPTSLH